MFRMLRTHTAVAWSCADRRKAQCVCAILAENAGKERRPRRGAWGVRSRQNLQGRRWIRVSGIAREIFSDGVWRRRAFGLGGGRRRQILWCCRVSTVPSSVRVRGRKTERALSLCDGVSRRQGAVSPYGHIVALRMCLCRRTRNARVPLQCPEMPGCAYPSPCAHVVRAGTSSPFEQGARRGRLDSSRRPSASVYTGCSTSDAPA